MKENNHRALSKHREEVLARLRPGRPAFRNDLARETGLSPATVSRIARTLVRQRVLTEVPAPQASVGRPVRGLEINGAYGTVLGVSLLAPVARLVALNLRGEVLREADEPLDLRRGPEALLGSLRALLRRAPRRSGRFCGVGLALPGQWSKEQGLSLTYPRLPAWMNVPIRKLLEEWTGGPAALIGYAPALALAEQARGGRPEPRNLLCAEVAENIALGVIVNGSVLEGASGNAGELGHIMVDPQGPPCYCGNRGCLESRATCSAVQEEIRTSPEARSRFPRPGAAGYDDVVRLAREGDPTCVRLLGRVGRALGAGLATALNLFNPELLVLNGRFFEAGDLVLIPLRAAIQDHAITSTVKRLTIERSALGPTAAALGAGLVAIREALRRL
jgi:predicted NBD/HSP70 family sugar kinase